MNVVEGWEKHWRHNSAFRPPSRLLMPHPALTTHPTPPHSHCPTPCVHGRATVMAGQDISELTSITVEDVSSTVQHLNLVKFYRGHTCFCLTPEIIKVRGHS